MSEFARLQPTKLVPPLKVKTVGGPCWRLCDQKPKHFTLVLFYRGLHCRFCEAQLREFEARYDDFHKLGVRVLAVDPVRGAVELAQRLLYGKDIH